MQIEASRERSDGAGDELFEALADRRRRRVLAVLRADGGSLTLTELAEELVTDSRDGGVGTGDDRADTDDADLDRVRIELYHRHLPVLSRADLVEFDTERNIASLAAGIPDLATVDDGHDVEVR